MRQEQCALSKKRGDKYELELVMGEVVIDEIVDHDAMEIDRV